MCGRSAASSPSLCLDSQFSRERVESTNWSKSSKFSVHRRENKFKQWIQNIKNTDSHKLDLYHGKKCSDIGPRARPSTSCPDYCNTTPRRDQRRFPPCSTRTLMSLEIRTVGFPTEVRCQICSISRQMNIKWSLKLFNSAFHHGTQDPNTEKRHERPCMITDN